MVGDVEALLDTYASDGSLAATIDAWMGELEANLDRGFQTLLSKHGVGSWGLRRAEPWEHHDALVTPFHADLPSVTTTSVPTHLPIGRLVPGGGGGRRFDEGWLRAQCAKLKDAARDVERNHLAEAFTAVEHNAAQYTARWIDDEQRQVDELLRASPTGWKEALERLTRVVGEVEHRIEEWRERLRTARYRPLDTEYAERQGRTLLDQLQGVVDEKPHVARALRTGLTVGVAAGVAFGAALTLILPWAPGGVGALVLPAVAAGIWSAWRRLRQDEAQRTDTINALIDPEEGAFRRAFEEQQARIFDPASPTSYIGERVAWTCMLWRMRIWQGIQRALRQDIARLTDVGAAMDLQLHRVREDQEAIDVRFQEEDGTMLEDVERALESPDLFRRLLVGPGVLDAVYQTFSKPEARYADRHLHEEEPFELWRERTPFTDPDEMRRYCGVPFGEVLALDFFRFERTAPAVRAALADFLSDFTHKLALQSDHEALVRDLLPAGKWPVGWTLDTGLPDPHAVVMIRHVQDLAPWQLPALGSPADLVRSLLDTGGGETLPGVLASVPTLALRSVMAGVALDLLACGEADGPDSLCAELLKVALPRVSQGQAATDGHPWVPVERARAGWVERLQGQEGCLELAVVLYGSPPAPEHAGLELALARVELLLAAAEGQAEWAYDALGAVPRHWVAPLVLRLVEARLVGEYLTQRLYRDALAMLVRLEPQSLRASMIVRAAAQAVRQGAPEAAREIIALARAPRERKREPMPASFDLPHDEAHELVATLGQTDGLALALLGVYGAADHGPTASEPEWRVELLLKALDRGEAGAIELLGMAAEFPRGAVDPRLSRALRRVAAGAIDANRPIETTDAGEGA